MLTIPQASSHLLFTTAHEIVTVFLVLCLRKASLERVIVRATIAQPLGARTGIQTDAKGVPPMGAGRGASMPEGVRVNWPL